MTSSDASSHGGVSVASTCGAGAKRIGSGSQASAFTGLGRLDLLVGRSFPTLLNADMLNPRASGEQMARIVEEIPNSAGTWLTIEEAGAQLRALVHNAEEEREPGVTVFWPARRSPITFADFFDEALPRTDDSRSDERPFDRGLLYLRETGEAEKVITGDSKRYEDSDFVRFERIRTGAGGAEHPVLVAWANLDAGDEADVPADAAGVLLQPRHFQGLEEPLAKLIANTSVEEPKLGTVASLLLKLRQYLRPDATPIAAAA